MTIQAKQYVTDSRGRKKAVILSMQQYERMQQDIHDLAVVAERRDEKVIGLDEMKRRLKKVHKIKCPAPPDDRRSIDEIVYDLTPIKKKKFACGK